jgi:hypothetical protein
VKTEASLGYRRVSQVAGEGTRCESVDERTKPQPVAWPAAGRVRPRAATDFVVKSAEELSVPEFERLYAAGEREPALELLRKLDFTPLDAILVVREAEPGATIPDAVEIVFSTAAYADLAADFRRQQEDFWAVMSEGADEFVIDEPGHVSAVFDLRKERADPST